MKSRTDKSQENKQQSIANEVPQKQGIREGDFQFEDKRPETEAKIKLQTLADNSPQIKQLKAFSETANNSNQADQAAQFQTIADNQPTNLPLEKELLQAKAQRKHTNTGLTDTLKTGLEPLSGYSLDEVQMQNHLDRSATHTLGYKNPIQLAWERSTNVNSKIQWDTLRKGMRWHVKENSTLWFEGIDEKIIPTEQVASVKALAGPDNAKTYIEWADLKIGGNYFEDLVDYEIPTKGIKAALKSFGETPEQREEKQVAEPVEEELTKIVSEGGDAEVIEEKSDESRINHYKALILKNIVQHPKHSAPIAQDLAKHWVDRNDEEEEATEVTVEWLMKLANSFGYPDDHAEKLAKKEQYEAKDIKSETDAEEEEYPSYEVDSFEEQKDSAVTRHALYFSNVFDVIKNSWTMNINARNPLISNFKAPDVYEIQMDKAREKYNRKKERGDLDEVGLSEIIRHNVISTTGEKWYADNKIVYNANRQLTEKELATFLKDTENGYSSNQMAIKMNKKIIKGYIDHNEVQFPGFNIRLLLEDQEASS